MSGNTVWPEASDFQKIVKIDYFLTFLMNFCSIKMLNETFSVIFKHCVQGFFILFYLLSCLVLRLYLVSFHLEKALCTKKQSRKSSIKYIPGQTVVHFARSTWDPSHMGPPHLGVGLSHLRSLLWYPWPHFELHWLHSDQLDQPPLTGKSDLSNSIGIQKIVGNMPKILLWIVLPLFVHPLAAAVAKSPCKQLHSGDLITCCPRRQWVPKDRVFIDFSKGIKCARI